MLDIAGGGSSSPSSKMTPELSRQEQQEQQQRQSDDRHEVSVPGTPPRSPARNGHYTKLSCGKEEEAVMSLMKLATPVKSPGRRSTMSGGVGEITPGTGHAWGDGAEMTPVSFFRRSRQSSDFGGHLQSPFQSPLKNFQFSPSCLFSPPGAGTLDFPLSDTPGRSSNRDLWQQTTPDRHGIEDTPGRGSDGAGSGSRGGGSHGGGGGAPSSCGKRKSTALFADKRGPQDHSRGLGQAWCLGTPCRPPRESGLVHLGVADIPATPDRPTGADGAQVLPPTPRLLPPTPPPLSSNDAEDAAGGDGAAGILMGLRSPESLSSLSGGGNVDHPLFTSLEDDGHPGIVERGWNEDWDNTKVMERIGGGGKGSVGGGNETSRGSGVGDAPHTAPVKRHKRWASSAVSLRDAHCKGSFTIERGTLIRSTPSSSTSGYAGASSGGGTSVSKKSATKKSRGPDSVAKRNVPSRVKNSERNTTRDPLSPPKPVLSPASDRLAISLHSASISPVKTPAPPRKEMGGRGPSTAPRSLATRGARGDRARRGSVAKAAASANASTVTPSPAAPGSSKSGRSKPTPRATSGSGITPARSKAKVDMPSLNNPEPTSSAPSQRRGKTSAQKQKKEEGDDDDERSSTTSGLSGVGGTVEVGPTTCNCKKSKCLKLYCECFQRRLYCSDCNCLECMNTPHTEDLRQVAIQSTIERNPLAFESKFEKRAGKRSHNAGCNCKKSACLKKYCECFQAGVACGTNCKCSNCRNYEGATGGRKRRATESLPPRTPPALTARGRGAAPAAAAVMLTMAAPAAAVEEGFTGDEEAVQVSVSETPRMLEPHPSPDHEVQVGGDDEDDGYSVPPSPLVEALRARPGGEDALSFYSAGATPDEAADDSGNCSSGSGGGDPSDTPAAAAGAAVAAHNNRSASNRSDISPAASAVADFAVAKSALDMGGTPLQMRKGEAAHDTKFELSVSAASPGGVHALSARLLQQQEGVPRGCGGGKVLDGESAIGMGDLMSRPRREAFEKGERDSAKDNASVATADKKSIGDGNGGFVASSRGKAGGQACFTPPTPPPTWEEVKPGFDDFAAESADPGSIPCPYGVRDEVLMSGAVHVGDGNVVTAPTPEVTSASATVSI